MKNFIKRKIRESISASEATSNEGTLSTIINGKRNVAWLVLPFAKFKDIIEGTDISVLKVPSRPEGAYILYRTGYHDDAEELLGIAEKYKGYLSTKANKQETIRIGQLLGYNESDIMAFVKEKYPNEVDEQMVDGQNMNQGTETVCDKMSVATYDEGIKLIIAAIGKPEENPQMWKRISKPLQNWKQANKGIGGEVKTMGMSGDSMVDESNTWWTAIQSTICEQGGDGQGPLYM